MNLHIGLNGRDITEYGVTPLDGTLNALLKPAGYKKIVTNSNAAFDGVIPVINANRKRDSRNVTLNFKLTSASLIDRMRDVENLEAVLVKGTGGGVNELYVSELDRTYRLIYDGMPTFNAVMVEKAIIALRFLEFCPTEENRVP